FEPPGRVLCASKSEEERAKARTGELEVDVMEQIVAVIGEDEALDGMHHPHVGGGDGDLVMPGRHDALRTRDAGMGRGSSGGAPTLARRSAFSFCKRAMMLR